MMIGARVSAGAAPSLLLKPLAALLDECWWYLGGAGVQLPCVSSPAPPTDHTDAGIRKWRSENAQWFEAQDRAAKEYDPWIDDTKGYRVGLPGWFSRYVDLVDANWNLYFACEPADGHIPREALNQLDRLATLGTDWFGEAGKWNLPAEVVLVCRNVDSAYWDLFVRDLELTTRLRDHLSTLTGIRSSELKVPGYQLHHSLTGETRQEP